MDDSCSVTVYNRGKIVDLDFIMRDRIEHSICSISTAELYTAVDEALKSLDIPQLKE